VTVPFCCGCGSCGSCRQGETQLCERDLQPGFTMWGSFAEYVALPRADLNLVRLPSELDFVDAASLGCRFMTAWAALHVHAQVRAGEWVAVHGCGGVGMAAIMIAVAAGAQVAAVDIDERKLERARQLGAVPCPAEAIPDVTGGGAHVSIDALGSAVTCVNSIRCLRRRGRHIQVGLLLAGERKVAIPMARVIAHELRVFGVHGMAVRHYEALVRAVSAGTVVPGSLVAKTIALDEVGDELASMGRFAQEGVTVVTA
jgi:alcohol dehydrogenase